MNELIPVFAPDAGLSKRLDVEKVVLVFDKLEDTLESGSSHEREQSLHCVIVREARNLDLLTFEGIEHALPIALFVPAVGSIRIAISRAKVYSAFNLRIFLPALPRENLVHARILASLGIEMAVVIPQEEKDLPWDEISDLMHYAVYSPSRKGSIEPFERFVTRGDTQGVTAFGSPWFDDPERFIHIDAQGRLAFSKRDLEEGHFLQTRPEELSNLHQNEEYQGNLKRWQASFLRNSKCSYCAAWSACQGAYIESCSHDPRCEAFFSEMVEALDFRSQNRGRTKIWQS